MHIPIHCIYTYTYGTRKKKKLLPFNGTERIVPFPFNKMLLSIAFARRNRPRVNCSGEFAYVSEAGQPCSTFLKIVDLVDGTAECIEEAIKAYLAEKGLPSVNSWGLGLTELLS